MILFRIDLLKRDLVGMSWFGKQTFTDTRTDHLSSYNKLLFIPQRQKESKLQLCTTLFQHFCQQEQRPAKEVAVLRSADPTGNLLIRISFHTYLVPSEILVFPGLDTQQTIKTCYF